MSQRLLKKTIKSVLDQYKEPARLYIGYSGGLDSHVLLHICASIEHLRDKLAAVHIHHNLQKEADAWAEHCKKSAKNLGVEFILLKVNAAALSRESPEEAARNARYNALRSLIGENEVLLIGQHREDQLETVLLQLFRGSGLRGLSGIPESMVFGSGVIHRPLLNIPKEVIQNYALAHQLQWIEDPSNRSNAFDRNYLRNVVIPLIKKRWKVCDKTVARSAKHCAEAQILISAIASELFDPVFDSDTKTLCVIQLKAHKSPRQKLIIRHWFQHLGLKMPSQAFLKRVQDEVISARDDSEPLLIEQACHIRRYRNRLYCIKISEQETFHDFPWNTCQTSIDLTATKTLSWQPESEGIPLAVWQTARVMVKFRCGGEKIKLPYRKGHHSLKNLFQEAGIPPWERDCIPLIYLNDKLAAVGELWISAEFYAEQTDDCVKIVLQKKIGSSLNDYDERVAVL